MTDKKIYYCSFCGKNQHEASLIIAGFDANICSDCVLTCVEVVFKKGLNKVESEPKPNYAFPEEKSDES